jgi:hypothetical protein
MSSALRLLHVRLKFCGFVETKFRPHLAHDDRPTFCVHSPASHKRPTQRDLRCSKEVRHLHPTGRVWVVCGCSIKW